MTPSVRPLDIGQLTDPGRDPRKQQNEDACGHAKTPLGYALVVCDGMGGHSGGQAASTLALETILTSLQQANPAANPGAALSAAIAEAGAKVFALGERSMHFGRPGSTCVALLIHGEGVEVAHVGDSRAYLIRAGQVQQLTKDHSMVQQMVDAGLLHQDQAAHHPDANKITRALGLLPQTEVELRQKPIRAEEGDIFLLGSDGLWDLVIPDEVLAAATQASSAQEACVRLVELANSRGGHDNITVQMVKVSAPQGSGIAPTILQQPARVAAAPVSKTLPGDEPSSPGTALDRTPTDIPPVASFHDPAPRTDASLGAPRKGAVLFTIGAVLVVLIVGAIVVWWMTSHQAAGR